MAAGTIVLLVAAPLAGAALIATTLVVVLRNRVRASRARLAAELANEPAVRGPEGAFYRGSTGSYSNVSGNGQIVLTGKRLLFQKVVGSLVTVDCTT